MNYDFKISKKTIIEDGLSKDKIAKKVSKQFYKYLKDNEIYPEHKEPIIHEDDDYVYIDIPVELDSKEMQEKAEAVLSVKMTGEAKFMKAAEDDYNLNVYNQENYKATYPGSASSLGAQKNIPKTKDGEPDYHWNHKQARFDKAIEILKAEKPMGSKLNTLNGQTGLKVFQLDTGCSAHSSLTGSTSYKQNEAKNFDDANNDSPNPEQDKYVMLKMAKGNMMKPGHATSTAYTMVGHNQNPPSEEDFVPVVKLPHVKGYPGLLSKDFGKALFPYVDFYPLRVGPVVTYANGAIRKLFNTKMLGTYTSDSLNIAKGVAYARQNNADVMTMSIGGKFKDKVLRGNMLNAYNQGIIMVCAAGNSRAADLIEDVVSPGDYPHTIAAAAIAPQAKADGSGTEIVPWEKSCDGPGTDISAPGKYIYTAAKFDINRMNEPGVDKATFLDGNLYKFGGATSQATVHVASAAAMWKFYYKNILDTPFYNEKKGRIVEAFRWALYRSRIIPENWNEKRFTDKSTKAKYKGCLNAEGILDPKYAPTDATCQKFAEWMSDEISDPKNKKRGFNRYKKFCRQNGLTA